VPVGTSLQPSLRRDAVRKLLADDPAQVVWLYPDGDDGFVPESLPDGAFRPLEDWVDYVLDHDRQALTTWIQSAQFDFEPFVCRDDQPATPKGPGGGKGRGRRNSGGAGEGPEVEGDVGEDGARGEGPQRTVARSDDDLAEVALTPPSELQKQLASLEDQFLKHDGSLDAAERLALWPELAKLNTALGRADDAALCWMNTLWESAQPGADHLAGWLRAEAKNAPKDLSAAELDKRLGNPSPSPGEMRALAAAVVWGARQKPVPAALTQKLPAVQRYLEAHEKLLGVRAVWLAWSSLSRLSGADALGLARVRDRLLDRLLSEGLNPERDLPSFLRFAGQRDSDRMRLVREKAVKLREAALKWGCSTPDLAAVNQPYFDLTFAFAMARLGEATVARDWVGAAEKLLKGKDAVHQFLLEAFRYRVEQALAGRPHAGPLPQAQTDAIEKMKADVKTMATNDPRKLGFYIIERMLEQSQILEPSEKQDPYRSWKKHTEDLNRDLSVLPDIKDKAKLGDRIKQLLKGGAKSKQVPETRLYVLGAALPLAPRVGEPFTIELLQQAVPALEESAKSADPQLLEHQGRLIERALFFAAHYDRAEIVQTLVDRSMKLLQGKSGKPLYEAVNLFAGQSLRSLRKLGMRDEIHRMLQSMTQVVMQGQDFDALLRKHAADWPEVLRSLLYLSAGWLYFGQLDKAMPVLAEARERLFNTNPSTPTGKGQWHQEYTRLARTYATVLGQAPAEMALGKIEEMFRKLSPVANSFTSSTHFSRLHLNVVEDVVLAIVSDDFAHGPAMRRWLDDDEYLVRRRIHRDVRAVMSQSGL
jgi:hypothetical protein